MRLGVALVVVLASISATTSSVRASAPWASLRRPLHVPHLAPSSTCPISKVDSRVPWKRIRIFGGSGTGRGPVYPGLGAYHGLLLANRDPYGGPWFGQKLFWYVQPSYLGPVLIRGRRIDGTQLVRFNGKKMPPAELHIERGATVSWPGQPVGSRGIPSGVRLIADGCYGFQIDGLGFSRVVVFRGEIAR